MPTTDQTKTLARALADCDPALVAAAPYLMAALDQIANGKFMGGATVADLQFIARDAIAKAKNQA